MIGAVIEGAAARSVRFVVREDARPEGQAHGAKSARP